MKICRHLVLLVFTLASFFSCSNNTGSIDNPELVPNVEIEDSFSNHPIVTILKDTISLEKLQGSPSAIVAFAKTLEGIPYLHGSSDPYKGFDCSGFITYVFNHFDLEVPRSSIGFTHVGVEVKLPEAVEGDLILFTGTDTLETFVGHMGIITENTDSLRFIHSTSGKKNSVTITALNSHYTRRFVKVIRIF